MSGLVNAFPAENLLLWDLATAGRYEEALRVYRWYTPVLHLDTHVKLVQYIKLANAECGRIVGLVDQRLRGNRAALEAEAA